MKYIIIIYIALGLILSLAIGIKYDCVGQEMFPTYYGSPFVFKQESLASSMEYFYSVSGLITNLSIWSILIFFLNIYIQRLFKKFKNQKIIQIIYKCIVVLFMIFTTLNIMIDWVMIGKGFREGCNYWHWNMEKEAKDWGMTCNGKLIIFGS